MKRLGIPHDIVDYVEIDKYAVKSYNAINGTNFEPQDICQWNKDVKADIIMHGSPCQDFSIAGNGKGGDENSGTRSSLMYETLRIVSKVKPKIVVWENVKNVLSPKHRHNFDNYLQRMSDMGYVNYYQVLNAKDYNVPQNRERVFTISILGGHEKFEFPVKEELQVSLKDVLESEVDEKYLLDKKYEDITHINENYLMMNGGTIGRMHDIARRAYNENGVAPTMHTVGGGNMEAKVYSDKPFIIASRGRYDENGKISQHLEPNFSGTTNTLTTVQKDNILCTVSENKDGCYIRKLTPREYWRLMSFSDEDFDKAAKVNSNSQLYKQAGNSIVVEVLCRILECLGFAEKKTNFQ